MLCILAITAPFELFHIALDDRTDIWEKAAEDDSVILPQRTLNRDDPVFHDAVFFSECENRASAHTGNDFDRKPFGQTTDESRASRLWQIVGRVFDPADRDV